MNINDGTYIQCGFAGHMQAFSLGAYIYLAHTSTEELWRDIYEDLKLNTVDGHLDAGELKKPVSFYAMVSYQSGNIKNDASELYQLVGGAKFIGSDYNKQEVSKPIQDLAKQWIVDNGHNIWAIRCALYMVTDDNFFDDNSKADWDDLMWRNAEVSLPGLSDYFDLILSEHSDGDDQLRRAYQLLQDSDTNFKEIHLRFERMLKLLSLGRGLHTTKYYHTTDFDNLIFKNQNQESATLSWY